MLGERTFRRLSKDMLTGFDYVVNFRRPESDARVDVDDGTSLVVLKGGSESSKCIVWTSLFTGDLRYKTRSTYHIVEDLRYRLVI